MKQRLSLHLYYAVQLRPSSAFLGNSGQLVIRILRFHLQRSNPENEKVQ